MEEPIGDDKVDAVPQLPFSSYYGLLARAPARHSPVIEEAIASGEPLPESAVGSPQGTRGASLRARRRCTAALHGGEICADSLGPGSGSSFSVL
jgi:hypothetical protein